MDSQSITNLMDSIYIPSTKKTTSTSIPAHHPSLIQQDNVGDNHALPCGCTGNTCISNQRWWSKNSSAAAASSPVLASRRDSMVSQDSFMSL